METISSLLNKALNKKDVEKSGTSMEALPKSLQDLAKAVSASTKSTEKEASDSEKRQKTTSSLQRRFMADLEELARVTAALNDTQRTATQRSEERAKRAELAQKRAEARNSRAEKENGVRARQNSERQANWMGLIGAIGGRGFQGLVDNFVKAGEQTDKDVSTIAAARYEEKVASIDEAREDAITAADARRETRTQAAAGTYARALERRTASEGDTAIKVSEASKALDAVEKAAAELEKATAEKSRIEAEGNARISEAESGAVRGREPQGTVAQAGAPVAQGQGVLDASGQPVPSSQDVARVAAVRQKAADANMAAEAVASEKRDAYMKALQDAGTAPSTVAGGAMEAEAQEMAMARLAEATRNTIDAIAERADADKAAAIDTATNAKIAAANDRDSGNLVAAGEKSSVGTSNLLNMAVAPPAVVAISKAMDEFRKLFPVIGQAGSATVELSAILPAVLTGGLFKAGSMVLGGLTSLKEALPGGQSDVSKRYEKANARFLDATGSTRGEAYGAAYAQNVSAAKKRTTDAPRGMRGMSGATAIVRANAPRAYTTADAYDTAAGATHVATTREEVKVPPPQPKVEQSIGVVPVSASNRSVDEWR